MSPTPHVGFISSVIMLCVSLIASCGDPKPDEPIMAGEPVAGEGIGPIAGETSAGEMIAGDTVAGEVVAGEMMAGDTVAGEMMAGDTVAGEMSAGEAVAGEMSAGEAVAGEMSAGEAVAGEMSAGEAVAGEMSAGEAVAGEMSAGESSLLCQSDDDCQEPQRCVDQECVNPMPNDVDFCRIQWPLDAVTEPGSSITFYARFYEEGITDRSTGVDLNSEVIAEIGVRSADAPDDGEYEWALAEGNFEYDGNLQGPDEINNDEYMASITFDAVGVYEIVARFSVDGGLSKTLCDYGVEGAGSSDGFNRADSAQTRVLSPCEFGFQRNEDQECVDIDECAQDNGGCHENAACTNIVGALPSCECLDGYEGSGLSCSDINECLTENGGCDLNANCINHEGQANTCECREGYEGDGQNCTDINECATENGGCDLNANCINNEGQANSCECRDGYEGTGQVCTDVNECDTENGGCDQNAACINQVGADNTCECRPGYQGNGLSCTDINECETENGGCDPNANCINNLGQPNSCECRPGYAGSGADCVDINECEQNNGGCDQNANCINNEGQANTCECRDGYEGTGQICTDVNECDTENGGCDVNATCTNNEGQARSCRCNPGYEGNGESCVETPPISIGEAVFGDLVITELMPNPERVADSDGEWFEIYSPAKQINLDGLIIRDQGGSETIVNPSFVATPEQLVIRAGEYKLFARVRDPALNGGLQIDFDYDTIILNNTGETLGLYNHAGPIDEVSYSAAPVGYSLSFNGELIPDATLNDDPESFCETLSLYNEVDHGTPGAQNEVCPPCPPGYEEVDLGVCEDINECETANGGCDPNALCINNEGAAPRCECDFGFTGDGYSCQDVDECLEGNGGCHENATCSNNLGALPDCECNPGFEGDGENCTDIDECETENGGCDQNASCQNQIGADPICTCKEFYQGNGQSCEDIDECAQANGGCDPNATCTNNQGALPSCECNPFFIGNGLSCVAVDPDPVDYCRIQFPSQASVVINNSFDVYVRYYEAGITDLSSGVDEDERVSVEFGYGPEGSDPSVSLEWQWSTAIPTPSYDGNTSGEPNNDEFMASLTMTELGNFSYSFRVSVDLQQTWVYCDTDGTGDNDYDPPAYGFAVAQAGQLLVTCPAGQENVEGRCTVPFTEAQAASFINTNCSQCHSFGYVWYPNFPNDALSNGNGRFDYLSAGNYKDSYLWMKMTRDSRISGSRMPTNRVLSQTQTDQFAAYILTLD